MCSDKPSAARRFPYLFGQRRKFGFLKGSVFLVFGDQAVQFTHIERGALAFGNRVEAFFELLPERFNLRGCAAEGVETKRMGK
ncbi:hypothetical protein [Hydrogenophaga sp.]|uniref:hypothetical protein n=1 Tax=Hydrogenophaga sp. TaxID=1904254 RepID=UPI003F6CD221